MIMSSFNDCTQADHHVLQAALLFLQMQVKHMWHHQTQFQVIAEHKASHQAKTETHNPWLQLNQNWEILQSIYHNNDIHSLQWQLALDDDPTHQIAIDTANTCILEYQSIHPTLVAR
jgi:hypothetical protein